MAFSWWRDFNIHLAVLKHALKHVLINFAKTYFLTNLVFVQFIAINVKKIKQIIANKYLENIIRKSNTC